MLVIEMEFCITPRNCFRVLHFTNLKIPNLLTFLLSFYVYTECFRSTLVIGGNGAWRDFVLVRTTQGLE